jgi:spore maturation protein CgeB
MRFLFVNTDYPDFLHWLYSEHPGLQSQSYEEQLRARNESLFGVADFYSGNLQKLGQEASDIHANNEFMQKAWARQRGVQLAEPTGLVQRLRGMVTQTRRLAARTPLRRLIPVFLPVLCMLDRQQRSWFYDILSAQIRQYRPDVLINQDMLQISGDFLREMRPYVRLLVGQHAATRLGHASKYGGYDLIISSFPPTVEYFRQHGIPAELNWMGFEPTVLCGLPAKTHAFDVTFVGSFQGVHSSRRTFLEALCDRAEESHSFNIWAPSIDHLPLRSPLRKHYRGEVWGRDMYDVLNRSRITLNHHGDVLPYANNMRLFEATGVGTLLLTDWKGNLGEMFVPGKEVLAYRTVEECAELIRYYLKHDGERETIARTGQARTLRDHTYCQRMQELVGIVGKLLS